MRRRARSGGARQVEVTVDRIAAQGDAEAQLEGRPLFLPLALPGEVLRARVTAERGGAFRGEITELLEASAERQEAPCPHFGPCGGCVLQHWSAAPYHAWKEAQVRRALGQRGLPEEIVAPLVAIPPGTRRRTTLRLENAGGRALLGYRERRSHRIVDVEDCLLLTPGLRRFLAPLRAQMQSLLGGDRKNCDLALTESPLGLDLLVIAAWEADLTARESLAQFAEVHNLARVSWRCGDNASEPLAVRRPPAFDFGGVPAVPAPGGFLQPTAEGQALLVSQILEFLPESASKVADLFAGCGTFSFPLAAKGMQVMAVEGDGPAAEALEAAARQPEAANRIKVQRRDLTRQPLLAEELEDLDCVVFDPPRAGAKEQVAALAGSSVPTVIAVSCNPTTFARDARLLVEGGYSLIEVAPLDQFPWSGHVELVAAFRRQS